MIQIQKKYSVKKEQFTWAGALKSQRGITFVEIIVTMTLILFVVAVINTIPSSISSINRSRHVSLAKDIAGKQLNYLRSLQYANIPYGTNTFSDPKLTGLSGYTASYSVACYSIVSNCVDLSQETAKLVTVTITWKESTSASPQQVELTTVVSQGGIAQ